LLILF